MDLEFHQLDRRYEALRQRRPEEERRLLAELAEQGQQTPILVVAERGESGRYVVIDGFKRLRALTCLATDTVQAAVLDLELRVSATSTWPRSTVEQIRPFLSSSLPSSS
jgi:ParB-like chromosome segregation protein Spo0J